MTSLVRLASITLVILFQLSCVMMSATNSTKVISKEEIDRIDKVSRQELDEIRRKVDSMDDDELSTVLYAVMPHNRYKRTLGAVRRCIEKIRCLFGGQKRVKRQTSPAAILRAIGKLTGLASTAANELGNRLGLSGFGDLNLASLFRDPPSFSSAAAAADDTLASDDSSSDDSNVADGSEVVEEKICDQKCQLSALVYRRMRRLLRRL